MATLTPAFEERPPGPASVARFGVTRGKTVENARWGTATRLNANNMVAPRLEALCEAESDARQARAKGRLIF